MSSLRLFIENMVFCLILFKFCFSKLVGIQILLWFYVISLFLHLFSPSQMSVVFKCLFMMNCVRSFGSIVFVFILFKESGKEILGLWRFSDNHQFCCISSWGTIFVSSSYQNEWKQKMKMFNLCNRSNKNAIKTKRDKFYSIKPIRKNTHTWRRKPDERT